MEKKLKSFKGKASKKLLARLQALEPPEPRPGAVWQTPQNDEDLLGLRAEQLKTSRYQVFSKKKQRLEPSKTRQCCMLLCSNVSRLDKYITFSMCFLLASGNGLR